MRKTFALYFLLFSFFFFTPVAAEQECTTQPQALIDSRDIPYNRTPINKLGRGFVNALTCILEIPGEAIKVGQEKDPLTGMTLGVVEGFCTAGLRGLTGLFDVVTFAIPPYNKPLMQPEYALQSFLVKSKEIPKPPMKTIEANVQK
ncbi:MAG: exosortase system-associated protein, TIGR04073 family [Candidatus Omnitrophica bacterium]|nr:exosortase system-associated protein, TIGR04073 family [Candidatus Omnitrophota bacterium]